MRIVLTKMKKLSIIFLIISSVIISCSKEPIDYRLLEADSLLVAKITENENKRAESAESILTSINPTTLSKRNQAMWSLLTVAAKYRLLRQLGESDDSLISSAVDYFERNSESNYLARAYIYKGCVVSEICHNDSCDASRWYLKGIDELSDTDFFWRGYAHLRLAAFYSTNAFVDSFKLISNYRKALDCFETTHDSARAIMCSFNLGAIYCVSLSDSCLYYCDQSLHDAICRNDTFYQALNYCTLSTYYCNKGKYMEAKQNAQKAIALGENKDLSGQPYYYLACSYLKLGQLDSARIAANKFDAFGETDARHIHLHTLLAEATGNYAEAYNQMKARYKFRTAQLENNIQQNMLSAELRNKNQRLENEALKSKNRWLLLLSAFLGLLSLGIVTYFLSRRRRKRQEKRILTAETLNADLQSLLRDEQNISDEMRRQYELMDSTIRTVVGLGPNVEDVRGVVEALNGIDKKAFITKIKEIDNLRKGNIIKRIEEEYPDIKEQDINLLALTIYGFDSITTASLLGFTNRNSVYVIRKRIFQKLGIKYVEELDKFMAERTGDVKMKSSNNRIHHD